MENNEDNTDSESGMTANPTEAESAVVINDDKDQDDETTADDVSVVPLRKSTRSTKPTEKARCNIESELISKFTKLKKGFTSLTNEAEKHLRGYCPKHLLEETIRELEREFEILDNVYEEIVKVNINAPDPEIRLTIDRLKADKDLIVAAAQVRLVDSSVKSLRHSRAGSSRRSGSSTTSSKMREAAANAAARKAELDSQREEARKQEELAKMELEETRRRAETELQMTKKRAEIEQQRIEKLLRMEEAKLEVYQNELEEESRTSKLFMRRSPDRSTNHVTGMKDPKLTAQTILNAVEMEDPVLPTFATDSAAENKDPVLPTPVTNHAINTKDPVSHSQLQMVNDMKIFTETLAASLSLSRLPPPEPSVFDGDPMKYNDWSIAFKSLIEDKSVTDKDKIHYLKRYLTGPAKEAVSGYFLLNSPAAFEEAKRLLDERYGNQFVITEAFRNKLDNWPRIQNRDGAGLRRLSDFLNQCKAAMHNIKELEVLNDNRENRKILQKLPDWMITKWNRVVYDAKGKDGSYPSFSRFAKFVNEEADMACDPVTSLESLRSNFHNDARKQPLKRGTGARALHTQSRPAEENKIYNASKMSCVFCKRDGHTLAECRNFTSKPTPEKQSFVRKNGLCFGCLRHGHLSKNCTQRYTCKKCKKKHPTSLHIDRSDTLVSADSTDAEQTATPPEANCHRISRQVFSSATSMAVPVWISSKDRPQEEHLIYALLDTQSDTTFILNEVGQKLQTRCNPVMLKLTTMAAREKVIESKKYHDLFVRGYHSDTKIPLPSVYSREFIPADRSHIPTPTAAKHLPHLKNIAHHLLPLQDCEVALLIGYNCAQALAPINVIIGDGDQPFAIETVLGWSIVGQADSREYSGDAIGLAHRVIVKQVPEELQPCNHLGDTQVESCSRTKIAYVCKTAIKEVMMSPCEINRILESDFTESATKKGPISQDDLHFLEEVGKTIHQQSDGFYAMGLPFKQRPNLPDNRHLAASRLEHLKRKFKGNKQYREDYTAFMTDIIHRGDAEPVPPCDIEKNGWYIPHHGVYHPKKPQKIRVVFDCSAKCRGQCLNDHLLQGPDMTNSLVGVLCRFRQENVAFMCDIEKMFHQFKVVKEDRDYLRFLWFDNDNEDKVIHYRMKVHLFGATSSPGCANYALKQLAKDNESSSPAAARFIQDNFYVDDGLKSVASVSSAKNLIQNVRYICKKGNLRLHKFVSNSEEVLETIPEEDRSQGSKDRDLSFENPTIERALGIEWCLESDVFQFRISLKDAPLTRRGILSTITSIYDPLGFLAPFVLTGKQILQQMCKDGASWDDPLDELLRPKWEKWRSSIPSLEQVKISRCFKPKHFAEVQTRELHHFCDASTAGYGQCSYLRLIDTSGNVHCSFLMGKARVAPLKITTIPRLELQAAVVSVGISKLLRQELEFNATEHFWTDSKVALGYINNDARRFHVYVANRVQRIRETSSPDQWHYVSTENNPADHSSRGLTAEDLTTSEWFTGPAFLWERRLPADHTMTTKIHPSTDDPEVKRVKVLATSSKRETSILSRFEHFSDWSRAVKGTATLLRFIARRCNNKDNSSSIIEDRQKAETNILKMVQRISFAEVFKQTKEGIITVTNVGSPLHKFDPFIDKDGILRVGGRLGQSSTLHYGVKHPIILPKVSHITDLIIKHCHEKVAHQGRGITTNEIRSSGFWIIGCSSKVSSHIYRCITCRKLRGRASGQKMAELPKERTEPSPPFTYCGFDCFGPFITKEGRKEQKRYGLLFTCMASRAVHIEMLDDMTTDAFINALRCFIALRGMVRQLKSDQGTNFIGARNELSRAFQEIKEERVKAFLGNQGCDFTLNVPSASHMGGVWERQIRTIRSVLTALLRDTSVRLDSSSLRTFFYETMAIINSRPLTVNNMNDPSGPEPITPNHLITMKSGVVMPPPGQFVKEDVYTKKRWRRVQYLADQFWCRWKKEYLLNLQARQKWFDRKRNFEVGDIVLLNEEDLVRSYWKMARIIEVLPSKDNLVRKVKLLIGDRTITKEGKREKKPTYLDRPIHKLILLQESSIE